MQIWGSPSVRYRTRFPVLFEHWYGLSLNPTFLAAVRRPQSGPVSSLKGRGNPLYTILIADDNAAVRASVRSYIEENLEAQVCGEAENGAEAVEKVKELHPDVVILDFQMPVLDGLHAATQIRHLAPDTKIILFTMHASKPMMAYAHTYGVDEVVSKSDGASQLLAAIQAASRNQDAP